MVARLRVLGADAIDEHQHLFKAGTTHGEIALDASGPARTDVESGDHLQQVGDGPNLIQLLEPLSAASPVSRFIEKNGGRGGMAHVAFRVSDIRTAYDHMKGRDSSSSTTPHAPDRAAPSSFLCIRNPLGI